MTELPNLTELPNWSLMFKRRLDTKSTMSY